MKYRHEFPLAYHRLPTWSCLKGYWEIVCFFFGGANRFSPYAVNQIRTAFEAFSQGGKG